MVGYESRCKIDGVDYYSYRLPENFSKELKRRVAYTGSGTSDPFFDASQMVDIRFKNGSVLERQVVVGFMVISSEDPNLNPEEIEQILYRNENPRTLGSEKKEKKGFWKKLLGR